MALRRKRAKVKIENPKRLRHRIRAVNLTLIVSWDRNRVLPRMEANGFIKKTGKIWKGISKRPWTVLSEPEIIQRYNYVIRGYVNYYSPVSDYPTDIAFLVYLLKYSCLHTLTQKRRTSLRKILKKFGKNVTIKYTEKIKSKDRETDKITVRERKKEEKLLEWKEILKIIRQNVARTREKQKDKTSISIVTEAVDEICNVKINWRIKYKLSKHCAICGSEKDVEYHHVKHIKKGQVTGFLQVMKNLNRKQIPCCRACHNNIHRGKYDGMALRDLYDEELTII